MGSSTIIKNAGIGVIALIVIGGAYVFLTGGKKEESPLLAILPHQIPPHRMFFWAKMLRNFPKCGTLF